MSQLQKDSGIKLSLGEAMLVYALVGKSNGYSRAPVGKEGLWQRLGELLDPKRKVYDAVVGLLSQEQVMRYSDYQMQWERELSNLAAKRAERAELAHRIAELNVQLAEAEEKMAKLRG